MLTVNASVCENLILNVLNSKVIQKCCPWRFAKKDTCHQKASHPNKKGLVRHCRDLVHSQLIVRPTRTKTVYILCSPRSIEKKFGPALSQQEKLTSESPAPCSGTNVQVSKSKYPITGHWYYDKCHVSTRCSQQQAALSFFDKPCPAKSPFVEQHHWRKTWPIHRRSRFHQHPGQAGRYTQVCSDGQ